MKAAVDLVRQEGLGAEPTTLSYQRVFDFLEATENIRVTRASVHERIWRSQNHFQLEVLAEIHPWNTATPESIVDPATQVFFETDGMHPLERMRQMTRVAAEVTQAASEADPIYYSWVGMTMMLARDRSLDQDDAEGLAESVRIANSEIVARTAASVRAMGRLLGVRPRAGLFPDPEAGWRLLVGLGAALSEGATVRTRFSSDELPPLMLATGPNGSLQEWTPFAAGYWALLQTFLEVDPDAHPDLVD